MKKKKNRNSLDVNKKRMKQHQFPYIFFYHFFLSSGHHMNKMSQFSLSKHHIIVGKCCVLLSCLVFLPRRRSPAAISESETTLSDRDSLRDVNFIYIIPYCTWGLAVAYAFYSKARREGGTRRGAIPSYYTVISGVSASTIWRVSVPVVA